MLGANTLRDLHIGEGGLLHRFEQRTRLTSLSSQIITAVLIAWAPMVLFGLLHERLSGRVDPILHNPSAHVRLLVAAPVFLILDHLFPRVCRVMLEQLVRQELVRPKDDARLERMLRRAAHATNAVLPEVLLALLGLGLGIAALVGLVPVRGITPGRPTAAQLWYMLTDWPFFQFLMWRSLWHWLIWVRILVGLSRFDLALVPTHPDRRAGISFLRLPSLGYCATFLFAVSSVLCAEWSHKFAFGASLETFKPFLALFAVAGFVIAFGPLLLFSPQLWRARRRGQIELTNLATETGRRFHRTWLEGRWPHTEPLTPEETQPLSDLTQIYRGTIDQLRFTMVDLRDLLVLLLSTLAPILPLMLAKIPAEGWKDLVGLVTGGRI
jgi:hypothetical protein